MRKLLIYVVISGGLLYGGFLLSGQMNPFSSVRSKIIMQITSNAFSNNGNIPASYTCVDKNINPALFFSGIPKDDKSLALIMDDPDAPNGIFTHWVVYNIPPNTEGVSQNSTPPGVQVKNSTGLKTYVGPCPPTGEHRYYFKLYALNQMLDNSSVANKATLLEAMSGHILDTVELMGKFTKGL